MNRSYTLWDLGKPRAEVRERATQSAEDGQNLERLKEGIAVEVEHGPNKLERTKSMVNVAVRVAKLREESHRLTTEQAARRSSRLIRQPTAANYKASAWILPALAELERTVGRAPGLGTP